MSGHQWCDFKERKYLKDIAALESKLAEAKAGWDSAIADLREAAKICADVEAKLAACECAVKWALGEIDDFPGRKQFEGAYWWRRELRKRAFPPLQGKP